MTIWWDNFWFERFIFSTPLTREKVDEFSSLAWLSRCLVKCVRQCSVKRKTFASFLLSLSLLGIRFWKEKKLTVEPITVIWKAHYPTGHVLVPRWNWIKSERSKACKEEGRKKHQESFQEGVGCRWQFCHPHHQLSSKSARPVIQISIRVSH